MTNPPLIIDVLRHGETVLSGRFCGSSDPDLTECGWAQMRGQVGAGTWAQIVTSPLKRCAEFAQTLAPAAMIDPRFQEMHFGAWEARETQEIWVENPAALEAFWQDPDAHPAPNGERWGDFQARVGEAFSSLTETPNASHAGAQAEGPFLLITHAGVMRALLVSELNMTLAAAWKISLPLGAMMRLCVHLDSETQQRHTQLLSLKGTA
ncbi:MAG: histidine phosphatase family protein [Parvibaculum sp.]